MTEAEIKRIVKEQRKFFAAGATLPIETRIQALTRLKACILKKEDEINEAVKKDLGKSPFETYMCETGLVLSVSSPICLSISIPSQRKETYAHPWHSFTPEAIKNRLPTESP